jgi:protein FAM32A
MENVIGGALKLKKPIGGITKKKKKSSSKVAVSKPAEEEGMEEAGASLKDIPDTRTAYEKKWDEQIKKIDLKNAKSSAKMTHRERIDDFNHKLSKLSEHHDLPRVSGGA